MKRLPSLYVGFLVVATLVIGLEHLLVPPSARAPMVALFSGSEYATNQLDAFAARPWLIGIHAASGVIFASMVPLQLWRGLRAARPSWHAMTGWTFIIAAWCSAASGIGVAYAYPFAGRAAVIPNVVSAIAIAGFTIAAVRSARRRDFGSHTRWMLRASAIGLGIALSRLYLPLLVQGLGLPPHEAMAQVFWLGSGTNLLLVEFWIVRKFAGKASGTRST